MLKIHQCKKERLGIFLSSPKFKVCSYSWCLGKQDDFFQVFLYQLVLPLLLVEMNIFKWFIPLFFVEHMLKYVF